MTRHLLLILGLLLTLALPAQADTTVTKQVAASADDALSYGAAGDWPGKTTLDTLTATTVSIGSNTTTFYASGTRFQLNIPQGSTIVSAKWTWIVNASATRTLDVTAYAVAADTCAAWASGNKPGNATTTTASARYNPGSVAYVAGSSYDITGLAAAVQEVISRPGWVANNYLGIVVFPTSSTLPGTDQSRSVRSYDYAGNVSGATLEVVWRAASTVTSRRSLGPRSGSRQTQ